MFRSITLRWNLRKLSGKSDRRRRSAAKVLGRLRDPRAVLALIRVLEDRNPAVRQAAAEALGKTADPRAVRPLLKALADAQQWVHACVNVGTSSSEDWAVGVSFKIGVEWADIRDSMVNAIIQHGNCIVEPLLEAVEDSNGWRRVVAVSLLGAIRDPRAWEPIVNALTDGNEDVRRTAAETLGQIGDTRAVSALTTALEDSSPKVRETAAEALGRLRDPS